MKEAGKRISRGMTLVEIMIVVTVLLVVFAAIFLFFTRGTDEFEFARRQNELATIGRLALEDLTDIIIYAGYMPVPAWDNDEWHPIVKAEDTELEFYADYDGNKDLDPTDYRNITVTPDGNFRVTDHDKMDKLIGSNITMVNFDYLDEDRKKLSEPLSPADRDLVRHIKIDIQLTSKYRGTDYTTELSTTISPRNLGVNHNIHPAFSPPDPLRGSVVFNVAGADTTPNPTVEEKMMINNMVDWGLTIEPLTDAQMDTFDFRGNGTQLIILRHRPAGQTFPHPDIFYSYTGPGDTLQIPVVTLNADDAVNIFNMGYVAMEKKFKTMTPANDWHPVNKKLPNGYNTFNVYTSQAGSQSVMDSLHYVSPGDTVLTYAKDIPGMSGICVRDEDTKHRVVHLSAWDADSYTADGGWQIFYNVIKWTAGTISHQFGTLLIEEGFDDPNDYSWVDPGVGKDFYGYLESPWVFIPDDNLNTDSYNAVLQFKHCYWTRSKVTAGGYMQIDTTYSDTSTVSWLQLKDFNHGGYSDTSGTGYPGGEGIPIFTGASPGYSSTSPTLTLEEADLDSYRGKYAKFRWVFGIKDKAANTDDGWVVDDIMLMLLPDSTSDTLRMDPWGLHPDNVAIQPRYWHHGAMSSFYDGWYYHHLNTIDSTFKYDQGYAWTTWGLFGYIGGWIHDGKNDSWQIGMTVKPSFTPDPDPAPTIYNGSRYSGNDLRIDDGKYNTLETSYLLSESYDVSSVGGYSHILMRIYRCVRVFGDDAVIHVGFSVDSLPPDPMNLSQDNWFRVFDYVSADHTEWNFEEDPPIDLTRAFEQALKDSSYKYFWLRFGLFSGPGTSNFGGWNLDNIEIWGNNF